MLKDGKHNVPLSLLLNVLLSAVDNLLHHTDIVLVLRAERARKQRRVLDELVARIGGSSREAARERVELRVAADALVEEATGGAVRAAVLVEVLDERLLGALAVIVERLVLVTTREELDRGVALDTVLLGEGLVVLRIGVDVDDEALQMTGQHYTAQWMRRQG